MERVVRVTWEELEKILKKSENLLPHETLKGITLAKPKVVLINTEYK